MIVLDGQPALSAFRIDRQNAALARIANSCVLRAAWHVYVVAAKAENEVDMERLQRILQTGSAKARPAAFWVAPRLGTISPWSSKATDILHDCGFAVSRVERVMAYDLEHAPQPGTQAWTELLAVLHDPMTQSVVTQRTELDHLFDVGKVLPLERVELGSAAIAALESANRNLGLALAGDEVEYLAESYADLGRDPTDAELMMFAQANSEHCRHKVFNADFTIDGKAQPLSLFSMIRNTHKQSPAHTLSAYSDNAAVIAGTNASRF
ncbi:MAG: phosphoribosylformylglycinamidine synthase, partial [Dokdonella sp.]